MTFQPKKLPKKVDTGYKTLYLTQALCDQIAAIAQAHDTSFNHVVVSIIESCLEESNSPPQQKKPTA